jgi:hypothetical protein
MNATWQAPTLPWPARVAKKADAHEQDVYDALADGQWHTAKSLGMNERMVRAVAERSRGAILGGQHGYRLTQHATLDEILHAEHWLRSQGTKMLRRSYEIGQIRHGRTA